jgi:two-component system sensor histidine kinase/response regulator
VRFSELLAAILAHDLRNPLTTIVVGTQILEGANLDGRARAALSQMHASETRMTRMIEQLLDVARSRSEGGLTLVKTSTDLGALARQIADELSLAHPGRPIDVAVEGDPRGWFDQDRMEQVLSNLAGNALEHAAPGPVRLEVDGTDASAVALRTYNRGVIPAEHLATLFDPFQRAASSRSRGLGLGLHITRLIASAHGGSADVTSGPEETRFEVLLPRGTPGAR